MPLGEIPSVLEVARQYAAFGFRVIPVLQNKQPAFKDWPNLATTDPNIVNDWWQKYPTANVGICPDADFCILDIDVKNGGFESLARLEAEHGKVIGGGESVTGGGGRHFFFRVDPARELNRKPAGKDGGIEIIHKGHQAIEFPSIHASGNRYQWVKDIRVIEKAWWPMAPEWFYKPLHGGAGLPVAPAPAGLGLAPRPYMNGSESRFQAYCEAALANQRSELSGIISGNRNDALNVAALKLGHLAHYGFFTEDKARDALHFACELNGLIADDGPASFEATFLSGWRKGITEPKEIPDRAEEVRPQQPTSLFRPQIIENVDPETGEITEIPVRFRLIPFMDAKPTLTARYLVKGLIPSQGFIIVWGPPKCGKSFWAADVCAHIAAGIDYRGKRVRRGKVVYVAAEGATGFLGRLEAWRQAHPLQHRDMAFWTVPQRLNLTDEYALLVNDIRAQIGNEIPDLVCLDTLNRTFAGSESSDEDMTAYITAADAIKNAFGCSVMVIHHCGIEGTRPRGHSSLTGAADAQIAISRGEMSGIVSSKLEWMKDGEEGFETHSKLDVVELGIDEDGDPVTTCVVVASDEIQEQRRDRPRVSDGHNLVLTALRIAIGECGEDRTSNHIPHGASVVRLDLWRKYAYAKMTDQNQDAKQKAFKRACDWLIANGFIGNWNDDVFLLD